MIDIQARFQSVMQVKKCNTFFRLIRSLKPGEDSGLHLAEAENELGLKNEHGEPAVTKEQIDELKANADNINYDVAKQTRKSSSS